MAAVNTFLHPWKKPATGGDVSARECLMHLSELSKLDPEAMIDQHLGPIANAVCHDIASRGAPHSFVAPTWNRPGSTMLAEHTASAGVNGPVIRVVVFEEPNHLPRVAVLWTVRGATSPS